MRPTPSREERAGQAGQLVDIAWNAGHVELTLAVTRARLKRRKRRLAMAAAGLCVAAAASWVLVWRSSVPSATVGLEAPTAILTPVGVEQVTRFADGSSATVLADGQLVVQTASETRVETVLNAGMAEFDVVPNPVRQFVVQAGPVTVEVIGTHFHVERSEARTRVSVDRGKVRVSWDAGQALLEAGESRWFPEPTAEPTANAPDSLPASPSPSAGPRERFVELARRGDYQAAYKLLSQSPNTLGSSAEELMLAADSARLSNHPEEALGYLKRVTREYPGDARAALSAFTQGRILLSQLGKPAAAAQAFELARRLSPSGGLAEDALARQAESLFEAGASTQGRALAAEYEQRYPTGKHLATLGRLRAPAD